MRSLQFSGGSSTGLVPTPGRAKVPQTTVINGTTYTYAGQKPPNLGVEYQMGNQLQGADGSLWAPMPAAGGGSGAPRAAAPGPGDGGGGTLDLDWRSLLPDPVPREPLPARVTPPKEADRTGADNATLAKAKQRVGQTTSGALKALQRNMQSRNISGSGLESAASSRIIRGGAGDIGSVVNNLAIDDLHRQDAVNDRNYAGDLGQRSGDMNFGVTQRGQDVNFALSRANMIPALISLALRNGGRVY